MTMIRNANLHAPAAQQIQDSALTRLPSSDSDTSEKLGRCRPLLAETLQRNRTAFTDTLDALNPEASASDGDHDAVAAPLRLTQSPHHAWQRYAALACDVSVARVRGVAYMVGGAACLAVRGAAEALERGATRQHDAQPRDPEQFAVELLACASFALFAGAATSAYVGFAHLLRSCRPAPAYYQAAMASWLNERGYGRQHGKLAAPRLPTSRQLLAHGFLTEFSVLTAAHAQKLADNLKHQWQWQLRGRPNEDNRTWMQEAVAQTLAGRNIRSPNQTMIERLKS